MAVLQCAGCERFISVSAVPGGNPVALADPERWSVVKRVCEDCRKCFCDRCAPSVRSPCPSCGGDFEGAPARRAFTEADKTFVQDASSARGFLTAAVLFAAVWAFAHAVSTPGFRIVVYVAAAVVGAVGLWKLLKALEKPAWMFFAACFGVMLPWVNLAVLLAFRVIAELALRQAAARHAEHAADGEEEGRPSAGRGLAPGSVVASISMPAPASPTPATPVSPSDPLDAFALRLAAYFKTPLRAYSTIDFGRERYTEARSFIVPRARGIPAVTAARKVGVPAGLIVFEGSNRWLGDEKHEDQVEIVVARGQSNFDAIRVAQVDPVNHGLSAEDVVARLERYHRSFGVEVFQADTESVVFKLSKLPASLDGFVKNLQDFCPDSIEEGLEEEYAKGIRESGGWVALWWD